MFSKIGSFDAGGIQRDQHLDLQNPFSRNGLTPNGLTMA